MPDKHNTENLSLDTEDWEIAFAPFCDDPGAALTLGYHFMMLRNCLAGKPRKIEEVIEGLDRALEVLFQHTEFHEVSYTLFVRLAGGKLSLDEERMLRALGVKF